MTALTANEQFDNLAEEVISIKASKSFNAGMEMLEAKHMIGRAILDHPLFSKNKTGQGQLLKQLAERVGLGDTSLRYCLEFSERFATFADFVETWKGQTKLPVWRDVVKSLPSGANSNRECGHERHEAIRIVRCTDCHEKLYSGPVPLPKCISCDKPLSGGGVSSYCRSCFPSSATVEMKEQASKQANALLERGRRTGKFAMTGKKHREETRLLMSARARSGSESPFWRGGVTAKNRDERIAVANTVEYKIWRDAVLKRDGYKCVLCGKNQKLQADHIKPFVSFPELRLSVENGRTLCFGCHKKTDTYGGNSKRKAA